MTDDIELPNDEGEDEKPDEPVVEAPDEEPKTDEVPE